MNVGAEQLVDYYQAVFEERFRDLPVVNAALAVEAVGFRPLAEHQFGALITPWFINFVLLPGTDRWNDRPQGSVCTIELPGGTIEFNVAHHDELGPVLSAAMFGTVAGFPNQSMARDVAGEALRLLFTAAPADSPAGQARLSRRQLFRG